MGKDNENENAASVLTTRNNVITQVMTDDDDDFEIDFMELFFMFRQHILMLILAFLVGGGLGYAVSKFVLTPTYTSTSMIYVMSKETTLTSLADLQIGSQLTEDYKVLVTSRTVMEDVIKKLSLDMDYYDLRKKITLDNPNNTRILNISVLDTDPQRAKRLTDAVADSASDYIADIMEQDPPKIIEYGEIPLRKTGPKTGRNAIIMAVVFELIAMAGLTISMLTNDTIRSEDDIKKYFNIPVLAEIPEDIRRPVDHRVRTGAYKDWRKRYNVRKFKIDEEFLRGRFRTLEDTDASGDTAQNDSNTGNAGADETSEVSSEAGFASSSDVSRNSESEKGTSSRWIF